MKNLLKILSIAVVLLSTSSIYAYRLSQTGNIWSSDMKDGAVTAITASSGVTFGSTTATVTTYTFSGEDLDGDTNATILNSTYSFSIYAKVIAYANENVSDSSKNALNLYDTSGKSGAFTLYETGYLTVYGNSYISKRNGSSILGSFVSTGDVYFEYDVSLSGILDIDGTLTLGGSNSSTLTIGSAATLTADEGILAGGGNTIITSSVDALSGNITTLSSTLTVSVGSDVTSDINLGGFLLSDGSELTIELIDSAVAIIESISVVDSSTSSIVLSNYADGLLQIINTDGLYSFVSGDDSTYLVIGDNKILITAEDYTGNSLVDSLNNSLVSTVVPEPSTYAMIFGAIALGLAAYRRRK